jgi:hypothetical protein
MFVKKRIAAFLELSIVLCVVLLPNAGTIQALELSGILSLVDRPDTCRIDFTKLDTPLCEIGLRPDTVYNPDVLFIRKFGQSPALYLLRAPYTVSTDSMTINLDRFSIKTPTNIDSLRRVFLPVAASVNPECIQSGQCDTIGGGFFIKTSEGGVAFFRPSGRYVGGYDRFFFFWAYSSDGTFGGKTGITRRPEQPRAATAASLRGSGYVLYDLQGRRWGLADKKPPCNRPLIINIGIAGQRIVAKRVARRTK